MKITNHIFVVTLYYNNSNLNSIEDRTLENVRKIKKGMTIPKERQSEAVKRKSTNNASCYLLGLWYLAKLSTTFQLYRGGKFY
jgi:hypothetical protein